MNKELAISILRGDVLGTNEQMHEAVFMAIKALKAEPVRHGHWIGKPIAGYSTVRCSVCRSVFSENNGKWNYCPVCGAKMDLDEVNK